MYAHQSVLTARCYRPAAVWNKQHCMQMGDTREFIKPRTLLEMTAEEQPMSAASIVYLGKPVPGSLTRLPTGEWVQRLQTYLNMKASYTTLGGAGLPNLSVSTAKRLPTLIGCVINQPTNQMNQPTNPQSPTCKCFLGMHEVILVPARPRNQVVVGLLTYRQTPG